MTARVGFVGLGSQGGPMARRINLDGLAAVAGQLLAKDVAIFADHTRLTDSLLIGASDAALTQMGISRLPEGANDGHCLPLRCRHLPRDCFE